MTPEKLRAVLVEHRLSVKTVAYEMHVSPRTVNHWLKGTRRMSTLAWEYLLLLLKKPKVLTLIGNDWDVD